jgi:uncharacterized protein YfiM (DUF2279 family)
LNVLFAIDDFDEHRKARGKLEDARGVHDGMAAAALDDFEDGRSAMARLAPASTIAVYKGLWSQRSLSRMKMRSSLPEPSVFMAPRLFGGPDSGLQDERCRWP